MTLGRHQTIGQALNFVDSKRDLVTRTCRKVVQRLRNGLRILFLNDDAAVGANGIRNFGKHQPQVFRNFGSGADGRFSANFPTKRFDGDRGRDAIDSIRVRLVQLLNELPRVRRKAVDVSSLSLGVQRIESQTRFSAATQTTKRQQLAVRDIQINVLEIVDSDVS